MKLFRFEKYVSIFNSEGDGLRWFHCPHHTIRPPSRPLRWSTSTSTSFIGVASIQYCTDHHRPAAEHQWSSPLQLRSFVVYKSWPALPCPTLIERHVVAEVEMFDVANLRFRPLKLPLPAMFMVLFWCLLLITTHGAHSQAHAHVGGIFISCCCITCIRTEPGTRNAGIPVIL